ncbi:MAG: T9SS type A sorting domain-containing protein [Mariniphaga sp.]|jgi:uncharacterized delta-60 repeat protein|nr:T9SS type A sorting domain-containing protein [Mariniphaga sp.]
MKHFYILFIASLMFLGVNAQNPGDLDPNFGENGVVLTPIGDNYSQANGMAIQPDGKIILAGEARFGTYKLTVARYNTDGSLDMDFGYEGIVSTTIEDSDYGECVALQDDGSIVVAGRTYDGTDYKAIVARYSSIGELDPSFGSSGVAHLNTMNNIEGITIQDDGKIVVGGYSDDNFALARLNIDGTIDNSFGDNGYAITVLKDGSELDCNSYIKAIDIQSDGKIVAAGFLFSSITYYDMVVARYTSSGQLDAAFAVNGYLTLDLGGLADFGTAVKIQDDDKIVIGGHKEFAIITGVPEYDAAIVRLDSDGNFDDTFGTNGIAFFRLNEQATYVEDIAIQNDGKIVFTGQMVTYTEALFDVYSCRINSDGTLDESFGEDGFIRLDPFNTDDNALSILIQEDGNILIGGYSTSREDVYNFMVLRLLGDTQIEIPAVEVTFDNIETHSLDATLTPNTLCESYYYVIMTVAEMLQWGQMMGSPAAAIKMFGIHESGIQTHHFTELAPNTDYYVYTVSLGFDGFESPYDSAYVKTAVGGGTGVATATIDLSEISATSVRMIVTPNPETAEFHDGLITKTYFDEIGEEAAIEYFQNDGYPHYETDNWVWIDLESNTIYKAIATCKNANDEWGPATIEEFITLVVSVDNKEVNSLLMFPNPSQGKFIITGEHLSGANLSIIDMHGKVIYNAKISGSTTPINLKQQSSGMYILKVEKDGEVSTSKFIINE